MKKHLIIAIVMAAFFTGCQTYDDTEITDKLDSMEMRIQKLENGVTERAQAIQKIVSAVSVSSVVTTDDGFTITFSDKSTYTIKNGNDGKDGLDAQVPVLGVKTVDGVPCWTINSELAKDEKGNNVPCISNPKLTPQFKVEENIWYCSFDGINWTKISTGGSSSIITFEETDNSIIFTIDGQKYTLAKAEVFSLKISEEFFNLNPGESATVPFSISGADESTHYQVEEHLYLATVDAEAKTITFTAPDASVETAGGYVIVKAIRNSDGAVSAQYIGFEKGEITVIGDYFEVPVSGGTYEVNVVTNMNYTAELDAAWLSVDQKTKAVRTDILAVTAAESKTFMERIGHLTVTSSKGDKFITVFKQAAYDDGTTMGVPQRPYLIGTAAELLDIPSKLIPNNDIEVYFELTADIDLQGGNFSTGDGVACCLDPTGERPIHFDGKGYTISGFTANGGTLPSFFGSLWGHVMNVTFDNANITATNEKAAVVASTVGLTGFGRDHSGYLENVHVTNSHVTHTLETNDCAWSGQSAIVAAELMNEGSSIVKCSATESSVDGNYSIGGIVAQADNGTLVDACCVKSCSISGSEVAPGYDESQGLKWNDKGWLNPVAVNYFPVNLGYIGAIAAIANKATIQNCYSDLYTSAVMAGGRYAGGVVGVLVAEAILQNCWAGSYVSGGNCSGGILGGIAWYVGGGNMVKSCIAWNKFGSTEAAIVGGNDSGNAIGAVFFANIDEGYGYTKVYDCYSNPGIVLTAGAWGTWTFANNSCPAGETTALNIHGFNTTDIIATARVLGWDESVWNLTGDVPVLAWE